jgi:hypothetical protein
MSSEVNCTRSAVLRLTWRRTSRARVWEIMECYTRNRSAVSNAAVTNDFM